MISSMIVTDSTHLNVLASRHNTSSLSLVPDTSMASINPRGTCITRETEHGKTIHYYETFQVTAVQVASLHTYILLMFGLNDGTHHKHPSDRQRFPDKVVLELQWYEICPRDLSLVPRPSHQCTQDRVGSPGQVCGVMTVYGNYLVMNLCLLTNTIIWTSYHVRLDWNWSKGRQTSMPQFYDRRLNKNKTRC